MPSGENMFYVDQEHPHNHYSQFIGEELVEMTRAMFPLSHKKKILLLQVFRWVVMEPLLMV